MREMELKDMLQSDVSVRKQPARDASTDITYGADTEKTQGMNLNCAAMMSIS